MPHGYDQRYLFNIERLLVFPEMISPTQLFSCLFVDLGQLLTYQTNRFFGGEGKVGDHCLKL